MREFASFGTQLVTTRCDAFVSNAFALQRSITGAFIDMKSDLESERRSMERMWTKRTKQLDALALNTAGMYGELEALVGSALPAIDTLDVAATRAVALGELGRRPDESHPSSP